VRKACQIGCRKANFIINRYAQLLENSKILLVIDDRQENISVYLEPMSSIGAAISRGCPKRKLRQDKVGRDVLITFDETKRMLSLCSPTKVHILDIPRSQTLIDYHSFNYTYTSSTKVFRCSKHGAILSTSLPGTMRIFKFVNLALSRVARKCC
jgi:hypothetical protein